MALARPSRDIRQDVLDTLPLITVIASVPHRRALPIVLMLQCCLSVDGERHGC